VRIACTKNAKPTTAALRLFSDALISGLQPHSNEAAIRQTPTFNRFTVGRPYLLLLLYSLQFFAAEAPVPTIDADGTNWLMKRFQRVTLAGPT